MPENTTAVSMDNGAARRSAADWTREMRMSADVNASTVGVSSDRVTPDLLLATSSKLLKLNKGEAEPDSKDSLQYQRIYSAPDYIAEHILKDADRLGRQLLWKATNRGNLDFITSGALDRHVSSVFNESKLSNMTDGASPLELAEASYKVTRIGEGGIASQDNAPIEMRLVQPSFLGYIDPVSTPECYSAETELYTKAGWKPITELAMEDELACLVEDRLEFHKPECIHVYDYDGMLYGYRRNKGISYLVTGNHRMWSRCADKKRNGKPCKYRIKTAEEVHGTERRVRTGGFSPVLCNEDQRYFQLPQANPCIKREQKQGMPPVGAFLKNVDKLDIFDFAELLGWYLAEGTCIVDTERSNYRVIITQSKRVHKDNWEHIYALAARLGFNPGNLYSYESEHKEVTGITIARKQLALYMQQFGSSSDKFIPDWLFEAPVGARRRFRDALLAGDGRACRHLCTMSKRLALDFERLQFGLGETVHVVHEPERRLAGHPGIWVVYWALKDEFGLSKRNQKQGVGYFTQEYKGKVYCPTVPGGLVFCRLGGHRGFWCGNSFRVGLDGVFTKNCMKGSDGKLYQKFVNAHTGKEELVDSVTAAKSIITTADQMDAKTHNVYAVGGKHGLRIVNKKDIDYYLPRMDDAFSNASNSVTGLSGVKELRLRMGCLHPEMNVLLRDENGMTRIIKAKELPGIKGQLPIATNGGMSTWENIRGIHVKLTQVKHAFRKVVLASGRTLITSNEHRWGIVNKEGGITLRRTLELKVGDRIMRSLFKDAPTRRTFVLDKSMNLDMATMIGCACRSLKRDDTAGSCKFSVQDKYLEFVTAALDRLGVDYKVSNTQNGPVVRIPGCALSDWLIANVGIKDADRNIPSEVLSASDPMIIRFLDAYMSDETQVAEDGSENIWLLNLPNTTARDALAYLFSRAGVDTRYRDLYTGNGTFQLALQIVHVHQRRGGCVLDCVVAVTETPNAPFMVDIDVDDKLYATANGIVTHNSKYPQQALSLINREAPLVQGLDEASGKSMQQIQGKFLGALYTPKDGVVTAVRKDRIDMQYDDGTKGSIALYVDYPMNSKGYINSIPQVKAGTRLKARDLVASSNYTDDKGTAALGANMRVGWISWKGGTYEDAIVLSESAAKKLTSSAMYSSNLDLDRTIALGKSNYRSWKPEEYNKEQLDNMDDEGIVKVGATLKKGDPMVLAVRTNEPSPGTLGKRVLTDLSVTWEHEHPGVVTGVVKTRKGVKVLAKVEAPVEVGDKLSNGYGNKGVVSQIIPDDQMPKDRNDQPLEMLMSPLGLVSRCYDEQTEFLTPAGWKLGKDVLEDDTLYCYDPAKDSWHWGRQEAPMHKATYKGELLGVKTRNADFLVTPNHKVVAKSDAVGSHYKETTMRRIFGKRYYIPAVASNNEYDPIAQDFELPEIPIRHKDTSTKNEKTVFAAKDWAEFLGWYLAEGNTDYNEDTQTFRTNIAQSNRTNADNCARITKLLERMGLPFYYDERNIQFHVGGKRLAAYMKQFGYCDQKFIPDWLFNQPKAVIDSFIYGLWHGAGSDRTYRHTAGAMVRARYIASTSKRLMDQVQMLLVMQGTVSSVRQIKTKPGCKPMWKCSVCTTGKTAHLFRDDDWYSTEYDGYIYCPTVDTGYILTRRNGKTICMGNTNAMQLDETQLGKIAKKTGKPFVIPAFYKGDRHQFVLDQLKQNHIQPDDDFFDPETGRKIPNVVNGYSYIYRLKHMADAKESARGSGAYTLDDSPGGSGYEGAKRFGSLEVSALVGHGAFNTLQDARRIRGQANSDFWREVRTGQIPTLPGVPKVQQRFFEHLRGAGVNTRRTPQGLSVFALSNSDVSSLAGTRELKSRDTYNAKDYTPMDGGLFGKDIFGVDGRAWGYIQLDEPVPNPVMADPLAKLLRMSNKQFEAVASGTGEFDGMSNSAQLKERLSKIDLEVESEKAKQEYKDAPAAKKDAALKRYVAIERMNRQKLNPAEYMLDRIPVLPPIYRPIKEQEGMLMVADANYLYARLLDARNDMRDAKNLPKEYQDKARLSLYKRWNELAGLYDPEDPKLKSKNVGGLLQWALGKGSPKFSAIQRKVVGMSLDTAGRGVVVPDSRLTLDEVGLPVSMAMGVMSPMVERRLVKQGYTPMAAMKLVKQEAPVAVDALKELLEKQPIELNRAPTLHKFNILAFKPKLVTGHAIHVHPSVCPGYAMDFDGDSIWNLTRIEVSLESLKEKTEKSGIESLTPLEYGVYSSYLNQEGGQNITIGKNDKCMFATAAGALSELPVIEGTETRKSATVTEWDVQPGFYTDTIDPETGNRGLSRITKVSRHTDLRMFDCVLSTKGRFAHTITASEDHSLITLDPKTLQLVKTRPEDAVGCLVPRVVKNAGNNPDVCARYIKIDKEYPASYKLGVFIGLMLGDGWISCQNLAFMACCDKSLQEAVTALMKELEGVLPQTKPAKLFDHNQDAKRFSENRSQRFSFYLTSEFNKAFHKLIGDGAYNKRIPEGSLLASRAHLTGILMGLLATDGSVTYSTGGKTRRTAAKTVTLNTTSCLLRDGVQELCARLGIRTSATPYRGKHSKVPCYAVTLSVFDLTKAAKREPALFRIPLHRKQDALEKITLEVENVSRDTNSTDIVPLPEKLRGPIVFSGAAKKLGKVAVVCKALDKGYCNRELALALCEHLCTTDWDTYTEPTSIPKRMRQEQSAADVEDCVGLWISIVSDTGVMWEHIDAVTPSACTEGWDCTVPGPYTFTLASGAVVQDTANIHAPVSDKAKREAWNRLLPSRNLTTLSNHKIMDKPEKEYMQGLYISTRVGKPSPRGTLKFNSVEEAKAAFKRGEIDVDTPIDIRR